MNMVSELHIQLEYFHLVQEEVNVEPGPPPAFPAAATADQVGGELEDIEAALPDVGVVTDDVPEMAVPQVLQLAVRERVGVGGAGVGSGAAGNATVSCGIIHK